MGNGKGSAQQRQAQQSSARLMSRDGKQSLPSVNDDAVLLGNLIALYLEGDWSYDEGLKVARHYAPNRMTDDQIHRAVLHAAKLQGRQLLQSGGAGGGGNRPQRRQQQQQQQQQQQRQQQQQQQRQRQQPQRSEPDNRVWLANVFQRIYGAGFNQPNGYKYTVAEQRDERGNTVRSINIFRPDDANAPRYVFRAQPDGTWTLFSGDGRELIRNVYYDPKTKRFFVAGVSEDDVLKTLQPKQVPQPPQLQFVQPEQPQQSPQQTIPGAVWFQMLDDNTALAKTLDGKIRVLQKAGENQWTVLREMLYDEFINPTGANALSGTNNQEQSMNWLYFMLPLLAIILSRR